MVVRVPPGRVATYGQVAALAGNPRAARAVVWVLRRGAKAFGVEQEFPWHRIVSSRGRLSLPRGDGFEEQRSLLRDEGVTVDADGRIDLDTWLWRD